MPQITDLTKINIDKTWSLFLDRDGVINKRLMDDYVKSIKEFEFLPEAAEAFKIFSEKFGRVFIITNQRGIARKLMTVEDLTSVHDFMVQKIKQAGGKVDGIYYCPHDRNQNCGCRKPDIGSALKAQKDFPEVDFKKSIMVGDTSSDIQFGENAGMFTVKITEKPYEYLKFASLKEFAAAL